MLKENKLKVQLKGSFAKSACLQEIRQRNIMFQLSFRFHRKYILLYIIALCSLGLIKLQ